MSKTRQFLKKKTKIIWKKNKIQSHFAKYVLSDRKRLGHYDELEISNALRLVRRSQIPLSTCSEESLTRTSDSNLLSSSASRLGASLRLMYSVSIEITCKNKSNNAQSFVWEVTMYAFKCEDFWWFCPKEIVSWHKSYQLMMVSKKRFT